MQLSPQLVLWTKTAFSFGKRPGLRRESWMERLDIGWGSRDGFPNANGNDGEPAAITVNFRHRERSAR